MRVYIAVDRALSRVIDFVGGPLYARIIAALSLSLPLTLTLTHSRSLSRIVFFRFRFFELVIEMNVIDLAYRRIKRLTRESSHLSLDITFTTRFLQSVFSLDILL